MNGILKYNYKPSIDDHDPTNYFGKYTTQVLISHNTVFVFKDSYCNSDDDDIGPLVTQLLI